jgi:hypothetical protein
MVKQADLFTNTAPGYYNTTNLKNPELKEKKAKAVGQSGEILHIFAMQPHVAFSPWDVYDRLHGKFPITSVRARITTLEQDGYLLKSDTTVIAGPYNTASYQWQLNPDKKTI